jgi:murein DD-endopeptidase MepM/ murein hydrolase activator NlpD
MRKSFWVAALLLLGLVLVGYLLIKYINRGETYSELTEKEDSVAFVPPPPPQLLYGLNIDSLDVAEGVIQRNENLSEILMRYNVNEQTLASIGLLPSDTFNVRKLQARKPYTIIHGRDSMKTAMAFVYHPNAINYVMLKFGDSLQVFHGMNKVDTVAQVTSGVIESSLYNTVVEDGGSPLLVSELADVYAWAIDFFGVQKGDAFKVMYDRYEVNGETAGLGPIKAAWFRHMGEDFYAIRYDQGEGEEYFDETGKSLRKTFLKAPLKFSRISSRFTYNRFHPVLKINRPHTGVDYAAPTGTPVQSVGDGVVTMAQYKGGGGNTVKIKHNSVYTTAYLHLSKYGPGIRSGTRVKQGQIIGYVGSTGLSTGPHLDFRFWKNGKPVDPLKIDPPSASPIREEVWSDYQVRMAAMKAALDNIELDEAEALVSTEKEQ